ncbi:MAG: MBL fold metallo-hydrolase [Erysipelotrichaceae bacterium]|nr:MBL fold metallo-hydrolase [Erysipelotrichaceae bacterium]
MIFKTVKFRNNGFSTQPFAFGGEEGPDKFDKNIRYRSGLQNYVIETENDLILVDTGLPVGTPEEVVTDQTLIYTGQDITDYISAFRGLGYKEEQVTKILLTHKHADHSGCLKCFPNAKIYINKNELSAAELQGLDNIVPVEFKDGAYHNFPESEKITDGVYMIRAEGHTNGNSIIIAEEDGLYYMFHGDITYTDEALYANKLSVVFENVAAARETMDRIRDFISHNPTVYISTHTPLGYENLEGKKVIDLNDPPETVPVGEVIYKTKSGKYVCSICGYVYDPAEHDAVAFEDLPEDYKCPRCRQPKEKFNPA